MKVTLLDETKAVAEVEVTEGLTNAYGTLHGGAICLIVDVLGTLALLGRDAKRPGVSVDLNTTFCAPAKKGERVICTGRVLRTGKTLGMTEVTVHRASDGLLVATGRHTKALGK